MFRTFTTLLLLIFLLPFAILACGGESPPSSGGSGSVAEPTHTTVPIPTPISVSAAALENEKELNEVSWKTKYNDNFALITGSINSITEAVSKYDVKLETDNFMVNVVCKVDRADESVVLSLQQGQTVSVLGRVTDDGIIDIVVKDCSIASSDEAAQPASQAQVSATTAPTATPPAVAATEPAARPAEPPSPTPELNEESTPTPIATVASTPEPTPTPTVPPTPTPVPPGTTLDNPVSAGEVLQGSNGTETVVTNILEDATDLVLETNSYNDPPEPGNRFYIVTVAVSYVLGTDSLNITESDYSLIGDNRVVYTPFEHSCGVIPDGLAAELFPGGQAEGNICFQIEADESNFVLIHEPFLSYEGERRFLSLDSMRAVSIMAPTATPMPTVQAMPTLTPRPTATPRPTSTPLPTPTSVPSGITLGNPVAAGELLQGSDGTEIVVTGITEDAWPLVQTENQFNDPPEPGNRFYMVRVAVAYVSGADSLNVSEADYSLIGDKRVVYTPFEDSCGVIPDELDAELFPGGQTEGNACFQIEADDSNFILIHEPFLSLGGERRFLEIE